MTKPYRPSNGTEGVSFIDYWCNNCARDAEFRNGGPDADPAKGCRILADTFAYDIAHPDYPKELVYGDNGEPCCAAFTEDPTQPVRCDKTLDMFGDT